MAGDSWEPGASSAHGNMALPQVIQQPPKPGALIRPPQVTLTQTPMVALRQPHNRIVLTTPQQIQLNPLQPGEAAVQGYSLKVLFSSVLTVLGHTQQSRLSVQFSGIDYSVQSVFICQCGAAREGLRDAIQTFICGLWLETHCF